MLKNPLANFEQFASGFHGFSQQGMGPGFAVPVIIEFAEVTAFKYLQHLLEVRGQAGSGPRAPRSTQKTSPSSEEVRVPENRSAR